MKTFLALVIGSYGHLLRLYPHSYQEEFAKEMLADFSDMAMDTGEKGKFYLIGFCLRELIDFPVSLLKAHLRQEAMSPNFRPRAVRNILRIALAFGLALAVNTFAGIIAFMPEIPLPTIWQFWHFLGWHGPIRTYRQYS